MRYLEAKIKGFIGVVENDDNQFARGHLNGIQEVGGSISPQLHQFIFTSPKLPDEAEGERSSGDSITLIPAIFQSSRKYQF